MLYVYKIIRLVIMAIIITYFIGCFWWYFCTITSDGDDYKGFLKHFELTAEGVGKDRQLVISSYYALTTLSTVGYGDFYPISNRERMFAVVIMLGGVAFFSYIMGSFIEILSNYDSRDSNADLVSELNYWLLSMQRFTKEQPLHKNLFLDI